MRNTMTPYGSTAALLTAALSGISNPRATRPVPDPHASKAAELFGCKESDVTPEMRAVGKAANYFEGFGMGPVSKAMAIHALEFIEENSEDQVVPRAGIEPALLSEPHFECGASTNSANGANHSGDVAEGIKGVKAVKGFRMMVPLYTPSMGPLADAVQAAAEKSYAEMELMKAEPKADPEEMPEQIGIWDREYPSQFPQNSDHAFIARLRDLWQDIDLPNAWDLDFFFDTRGFYYCQVSDINGRCNVTGAAMPWSGRKWHISPHMKNGEIVQTAFKAVLTAVEHEAREQFMYKDQAIFDPHYDLEALVKVREAGNTEHRH